MIRKADINDLDTITRLASLLWRDCPLSELKDEFSSVVSDDDCACFIKCVDGKAVGFAQCGLRRDYVEGTVSSPAGYLEGIFIEQPYRRRGFAKELLKACENWAKEKGCREFASDCELTNNDSIAFHLNSGFKEANRIVCFTKKLQPGTQN